MEWVGEGGGEVGIVKPFPQGVKLQKETSVGTQLVVTFRHGSGETCRSLRHPRYIQHNKRERENALPQKSECVLGMRVCHMTSRVRSDLIGQLTVICSQMTVLK